MKSVFTTKEVGNLCGVDLTTVINWVKKGKMTAYRTAGGHRRIKLNDLLDFMKEYQVPIPRELEESARAKVLVIGDREDVLKSVRKVKDSLLADYYIDFAADTFEAGNKLASFGPDIIIVDETFEGRGAEFIIGRIKKAGGAHKIIVLIEKEGGDRERMPADAYLLKPFSIDNFYYAIERLKTG
ncbi:MAG: excisionase family DNA-binding protein [Elusimicrobia bacterium]|nr:excisionase family DNA-binding protein [Elusimicrobiota bacterium]